MKLLPRQFKAYLRRSSFEESWKGQSFEAPIEKSPKVKLWRLLGKVTPPSPWSKKWPKVKLSKLLGKVTTSRLWSKSSPKVKFWRLLGRVTPSRLWLNRNPNVKLWRLIGKVTPSRLWLNTSPNVKLSRAAWQDHCIPGFGWNCKPNIKLCRPLGKDHCLPGFGWISWPHVKLCRPLGKTTPFRLLVETDSRRSSFEDCLEKPLLPAFGWKTPAKCQALKTAWKGQLLPGFG